MKVYFASPFFTPEHIEREEALKQILRDKGIEVFSPKENCHLPANATKEDQEFIYQQNLTGIKDSDIVFVVTDGKDVGSIFEAGYSSALEKPIVYFCETLPPGAQFNLMLSRSGIRVFTSRQELIECEDISVSKEYDGLIE